MVENPRWQDLGLEALQRDGRTCRCRGTSRRTKFLCISVEWM